MIALSERVIGDNVSLSAPEPSPLRTLICDVGPFTGMSASIIYSQVVEKSSQSWLSLKIISSFDKST